MREEIHSQTEEPGIGTRDCGDCGATQATKPIAHTEALTEPVSHLCLECYASWISSLPQGTIGESDCLICGKNGEYATTRELPTFSETTLVVEGCLRFCSEHVHEFAPVAIGAD